MKRTYSQIDMDEPRKIARWRTAGISVDVIAEKLHRIRPRTSSCVCPSWI